MYELRALKAHKALSLMRVVESRIKRWRGLLRWSMLAFSTQRGEAVVQIVGERHSQVSRRDNLFSSWQRLVKSFGGIEVGRAQWSTASSGQSYFADARILHEGYESACAKVAEEAGRADAGVIVCSDVMPLLPPAPVPSAASAVAPAALPTKTLVLSAPMGSTASK